LNESGTQVDVELYQRGIANGLEAVNFAGFDDEYVTGAAFEGLTIHRPYAATLADKLDLVVRMAMWTRTGTGLTVEEKYGDIRLPLIGPNKLMRATHKRQRFLPHVMHSSAS
jgi:hypothetical protein